MNITDVKVFKKVVKEDDPYLGSANVVFDNDFVVYGIRIYCKNGERYIVLPSKKIKDKWVGICHPINKEFRAKLEKAIFEAFDEAAEPVENE